jgi:hypothetical protein
MGINHSKRAAIKIVFGAIAKSEVNKKVNALGIRQLFAWTGK